jgi:hypothetical protein
MMGEEKSLLTKIGDAVEAAKEKAQEMGASLVKKVEVAASDTKREVRKAGTPWGRRCGPEGDREAKAKSAEADAEKTLGRQTYREEQGQAVEAEPRGCTARRSAP